MAQRQTETAQENKVLIMSSVDVLVDFHLDVLVDVLVDVSVESKVESKVESTAYKKY